MNLQTIDEKLKNATQYIEVPEGASVELPPLPVQDGLTRIEMRQKPNSHLKLTYVQNRPLEASGVLELSITLEENATCETLIVMLGGSNSGINIQTTLEGIGSSLKEKTLYFGDTTQVFDMVSNTVMRGTGTSAEIDSKGILIGESHARFDGNIHIEQTAKGASARLNEHTLLLSNKAKINAIPGLKIDTNDVLATHSAGVTRIDDEQLFYAESRGIEEKEATKLIAEGFLSGIYQGMTQEATLSKLIKEKICRM